MAGWLKTFKDTFNEQLSEKKRKQQFTQCKTSASEMAGTQKSLNKPSQ